MSFINFLKENVNDSNFVSAVEELYKLWKSTEGVMCEADDGTKDDSVVPVDLDNLNSEIMTTVQDRFNKIQENEKENETLNNDIKMALGKTNTDINTQTV